MTGQERDKVERLRASADTWWSEYDCELRRAEAAVQELADLRAGIERIACAVDADGQANVIPTLTLGALRDDLRALLAGSGEQPGACGHDFNALVDVDEEGHAVCSECEPSLSDRPAPVAPDSTDVYKIVRAFIEEEVGFDGGPGMDDQARRLTDRVLAVVGQGVTAGCDDREPHTDCEPHLTVWADGATAEQREAIYEAAMGAAFTAAEGMDGVDVGGVGTLSDNRAAVLAVVGQGVTAEQAWDEGLRAGEAVERARWQWSAGATARAVNGLTERPERPSNPYRAPEEAS